MTLSKTASPPPRDASLGNQSAVSSVLLLLHVAVFSPQRRRYPQLRVKRKMSSE